MIPTIDIAALFDRPSPARDAVDREIHAAAAGTGFMLIHGLPADVPMGAETRRQLLRLFALPAQDIRKLWRQKFDPGQPNVYRGWFALQPGHPTYKEGIDMGPDVAHGGAAGAAGDPLLEATPLPPESLLPGWRSSIATYYRAMERSAAALMQAIARGLGLEERVFDEAFDGGISTLRLIRYPIRPKDSFAGTAEAETWVLHRGERRHLAGRPHVDTGFATLLAQDGVEGLQARGPDGEWIDVPPLEGTLAVNFGNTLERWTGGRIKATQHRVLGAARERFSIPFFYEPRVDAVIAPLPLPGIESFAPFSYGDHLWATTTRFVEFQGLENLRRPRGLHSGANSASPARQISFGGIES
jgi:isopenicillin N synthase-like dioxygenase